MSKTIGILGKYSKDLCWWAFFSNIVFDIQMHVFEWQMQGLTKKILYLTCFACSSKVAQWDMLHPKRCSTATELHCVLLKLIRILLTCV